MNLIIKKPKVLDLKGSHNYGDFESVLPDNVITYLVECFGLEFKEKNISCSITPTTLLIKIPFRSQVL